MPRSPGGKQIRTLGRKGKNPKSERRQVVLVPTYLSKRGGDRRDRGSAVKEKGRFSVALTKRVPGRKTGRSRGKMGGSRDGAVVEKLMETPNRGEECTKEKARTFIFWPWRQRPGSWCKKKKAAFREKKEKAFLARGSDS